MRPVSRDDCTADGGALMSALSRPVYSRAIALVAATIPRTVTVEDSGVRLVAELYAVAPGHVVEAVAKHWRYVARMKRAHAAGVQSL